MPEVSRSTLANQVRQVQGALVLSSGVPLAADAPVERPPAAAMPGLRELLAAQESGIG